MLMRSVPDQNAAQKSIVIPGKLAIAGATRNPGILRILDAGFHRHDEKHHYIRSTNSITTVAEHLDFSVVTPEDSSPLAQNDHHGSLFG